MASHYHPSLEETSPVYDFVATWVSNGFSVFVEYLASFEKKLPQAVGGCTLRHIPVRIVLPIHTLLDAVMIVLHLVLNSPRLKTRSSPSALDSHRDSTFLGVSVEWVLWVANRPDDTVSKFEGVERVVSFFVFPAERSLHFDFR